MSVRTRCLFFLSVFAATWVASAGASDSEVDKRLALLESRLAEIHQTTARVDRSLQVLTELNDRLNATREMAISAINGQKEVLVRSQAIVDRASGNRGEIEELQRKLILIETELQRQQIASYNSAPRSIGESGWQQEGNGGSNSVSDAAGAVPTADSIGPCRALKAGSQAAWQSSLDGLGGGLKFVSVDLSAGLALVTTKKGNREAISARDILEQQGCV